MTVLGIQKSVWLKFAAGALLAAVGWWLTVRDGLALRPTHSEVSAKIEKHMSEPHPTTREAMTEQRIQIIKIQVKLEAVGNDIAEIKKAVSR